MTRSRDCRSGRKLEREHPWLCRPGRTLERENSRLCGPGRTLERENPRFSGSGRLWKKKLGSLLILHTARTNFYLDVWVGHQVARPLWGVMVLGVGVRCSVFQSHVVTGYFCTRVGFA